MTPKLKSLKISKTNLVMAIVFILGLLFMFVYKRSFFRINNITTTLIQVSAAALLAYGMAYTLIPGGIDLSLPTIMLLSAIIGAQAIEATGNMWIGITVSLLVAVAWGCLNGICITIIGITPFITTLVSSIVGTGLVRLIGASRTIAVPREYADIINGKIFGFLPVPIMILIVVTVIMQYVLVKLPYGRTSYAIGINPLAAEACGVKAKKHIFSLFVISATLAGIAGVILTARLGSASVQMTNDSANMDVVCSAVVGGVSIFGGRGTITGALLGTILLTLLQNIVNLFGMNYYIMLAIKGFILLVFAYLDVVRNSNMNTETI
jgi:ribose transport system permease protein